ncbi:hypothetical protein JL722_8706 [Aureococcus anophagefferens]|nr:hypothetical protein JL722_8706 [Aureococcus anophagefferens]
MPRKQSKSSGDSVAAARPSRRCCAVASECTPKLCVACKLGGLDVFACRETLGHVAPNWDAPDAGAFFADGAVTAAEAKALADALAKLANRFAAALSADSGKAYVSPDAPRADFGVDAPLVFPDLEAIDGRDAGAAIRAKELRRGGTPCVLTHAGRWLREDGSLDDAALVRDIGGEKAPILRYDETYADDKPIRESMRVAEFVEKHWRAGDGSAYLHQWQFPSARRRRRVSAASRFLIFVFPRDLDLHADPGGLDLVIAPLVGWKEVTLVHREDAELVGAMCDDDALGDAGEGSSDDESAAAPADDDPYDARTNDPSEDHIVASAAPPRGARPRLDELLALPTPPSLAAEPVLSLVRCWRHVLKPGECLVMPQGTLHAVRNLTPALSYHRFHLDTANLSGFWRALVDGDCSGIRPAEILWNGTHGSMKALDAVSDALARGEAAAPGVERERSEALLKLRHLVAAIILEFDDDVEKLNRRAGRSYDGFDWPALLADVDDALAHWRAESRGFARPASPRAVASASRACLPDADEARAAPRATGRSPGLRLRLRAGAGRRRGRDVPREAGPPAAAEPKPKKGGKPKFARVHYDTYAKKYDELVRVADLAPPDGASRVALAVGARVKVPWGTGRELYEAEIAGVHGGGAYKLHYLTIGGDWDQWVTRTKIIRKLKERA